MQMCVIAISKRARRVPQAVPFLPRYHALSAHRLLARASFSPTDGNAAFAGSSTSRLLLAWCILELCSQRRLAEACTGLLLRARTSETKAASALLSAVRATAFRQFCGGEHLQDAVVVAHHLSEFAGVRCIVDWSVEEREDAAAWDENARRKAEMMRTVAKALGSNAGFMPLKLTALVSPSLLERIAVLPMDATVARVPHDWISMLPDDDGTLVRAALERLRSLCQVARECGLALLLDAEQSNRQSAVHMLARELQGEFNQGKSVIVYDTLQMYLTSSGQRLDMLLEAAQRGGYTYAVKLVRGAYVESERTLGSLHALKAETDRAYDSAVARLLRCIASESSSGGARVRLMLATHNRTSVQLALAEMEALRLDRDDDRVHFAQILGMVDNITNALGLAGYNTAKLVVFGELREVLPWLLRRMQENRDAFAAQATELPVLRAELRRRLSAGLC